MSLEGSRDLFKDLEINDDRKEPLMISLANGAPGQETLSGCKEMLLESTKVTLATEDENYIFQYGPMRGNPEFLEQLASFLSEQYGDTVKQDELMVTAGATQAIHLTASIMFNKDSPVFVEDPTYIFVIQILQDDLCMPVIPVETDIDGIVPEALEKAVLANKPKGPSKTPFRSMVYLMTTFSNPTGLCSSRERCRKLVHLARKYDLLLFTDDVYNMLYYTENRPQRLLFFDDRKDPDFKGHVLSNGSFSKILAPGLRIGWIEAPEKILEYIASCHALWSGGCFNHYTSSLLQTALRQGMLTSHLDKIRRIYAERMKMACETLSKDFPISIKFRKPKGGFFLWIELPSNIDSKLLLQHAIQKHGVDFIKGLSTSPTGSFSNCMRISISFCPKDDLKEGLWRLKSAVKEYLAMYSEDS